ncbi:MAG: 50S ribosomal protein L6 [Candidatus Paceibacterota bacterium]
MSKIGKKIINIPEGIKTEIKDGEIAFQNAKGDILKFEILPGVTASLQDKILSFAVEKEGRQGRTNWGTMRSLANNAVIGLSKGFDKTLEIEGIGYKVEKDGEVLVFKLGFSHLIRLSLPTGIKAEISKNILKISGFDKALIGKIAAEIRELKKPEPYKGKGIRYQGEIIKKKSGKKVEAVTGGGAAK